MGGQPGNGLQPAMLPAFPIVHQDGSPILFLTQGLPIHLDVYLLLLLCPSPMGMHDGSSWPEGGVQVNQPQVTLRVDFPSAQLTMKPGKITPPTLADGKELLASLAKRNVPYGNIMQAQGQSIAPGWHWGHGQGQGLGGWLSRWQAKDRMLKNDMGQIQLPPKYGMGL